MEKVEQEVRRQVSLLANKAEFGMDDKLSALGLDSLDHVELVMELEEQLEVDVDDDDANAADTSAKLVKLFADAVYERDNGGRGVTFDSGLEEEA